MYHPARRNSFQMAAFEPYQIASTAKTMAATSRKTLSFQALETSPDSSYGLVKEERAMATNHELVPIALDYVDGAAFENFANAFFSAQYGTDFTPVGGMHDGGADGILTSASGDKADRFLQVSIRDDIENKVRDTIAALRKNDREPKHLIYATSKKLSMPDQIEERLFDKYGIVVRIRDRSYFKFHINDNEGTEAAFVTYLKPLLQRFEEIGSADLIAGSPDLPSKSLCVFLGQELDRRRGDTDVLESVTDSLILWALRDTDPDKGKFLTRDEIRDRIIEALPSAKQFISGNLSHRLEKLASKENKSAREVRHHSKAQGFCLPFDTRKIVADENVRDELLKADVAEVFTKKLTEIASTEESTFSVDEALRVCFRTVELIFQKQGIEVSHFLEATEPEVSVQKVVSFQIDEAMEHLQVLPANKAATAAAVFYVLRKAFYQSEVPERLYLSKLSRTFCLLFTLRNHPEIVEYFKGMAKTFVLYVGSDLLVRALSERFLPEEDRMTRNLFKLLSDAGSQLILSDRILDEVYTHVIRCDQEYKNHYQRVDRLVTPQLARQIDELLIRAYFYAAFERRKASPEKSFIWASFVNQFMTHTDLHIRRGRDSLQAYLCDEFRLEFEPEEVSSESVHYSELHDLKDAILKARPKKAEKAELLAENDAFQVLRVYSKRVELKEGRKPSRFGYRTWWLTQETAVRRATEKLVNLKGAQYILRPEFLLNYIALSPKAEEVRRSYETIFPSLLGVQLSNRMKSDVFDDFIKRIDEAQDIDESRARALASEYSNRLKADQFKQYEVNFGSVSELHKG